MSEPKLTKKEKKGAAPSDVSPEDEGGPGFVGYLVGGVVGLLLLLVLWKGFASKDVHKAPDELPHLVLIAEFGDLSDPAVRNDLARLQAELAKVSDPAPEILGPLTHPILVPNPSLPEQPLVKSLDALSKEEFQAAAPYFKAGGWLAPRIFSTDLTRACFRLGPGRGSGFRFGAGTRSRVEGVMAQFANSTLKLQAYSHALRFFDDAARDAINAEFGVQTAHSLATLPAGKSCRAEPKMLFELHTSFKQVEHPKMRSAVSLVSFWNYAYAVIAAQPDYDLGGITEEQYKVILPLEEGCRAKGFVSANGAQALLFVTTSAEAKENVEVAQRVSGNSRAGDFAVHPYRNK